MNAPMQRFQIHSSISIGASVASIRCSVIDSYLSLLRNLRDRSHGESKRDRTSLPSLAPYKLGSLLGLMKNSDGIFAVDLNILAQSPNGS
jgi:hypothetical protein